MNLSITPDQLASAGSYIARTWGDYGYRVEGIESPSRVVSLFYVYASDGSRFTVAADKWGNCRYLDTHGMSLAERSAAVAPMVAEMSAKALAA
jgi:hypothetical protein